MGAADSSSGGSGGSGASVPPPVPRPAPPSPSPSSGPSAAAVAEAAVRSVAVRCSRTARVYAECARLSWTKGRMQKAWLKTQHEWDVKMLPLRWNAPEAAAAVAIGSVAGCVAFGASRLGCASLLQSLRISSSNRILATAGGAATVVACAAVAAQATLLSSTLAAEKLKLRHWPLRPVAPSDERALPLFVGVGLLSLLQFRLLRGRLRNLAPSDVMRRGAFCGRKVVRAPGNDYADQRTKALLNEEGLARGCHSCGRSKSWWGFGPKLSFIGDHIPPNKYAKLADIASGAVTVSGQPRGIWAFLWPFRAKKTSQVFLPQCERCSSIQSNAVRMDRRTLIFPRSWRMHDVWLPLPLFFALFLLPFVEYARNALAAEQFIAEMNLGFSVAPIIKRRAPQADGKGWFPWW